MSTKIYDGLRIDLEGTDADIFEFAHDVRRVCVPVLRKLQLTELARLSARVIESGAPRERSAAWTAVAKFRELMRILGPGDSMHDPFRFSMQVMRVPGSGEMLAIPFIGREGEAYLDAIRALGYVRDYGYWDNTDAPDDVTGAEWDERKHAWCRALGDEGVPGRRGVTMELGASTIVIEEPIAFRDRDDPVWREIVALQPESDTPFTVEDLLGRERSRPPSSNGRAPE